MSVNKVYAGNPKNNRARPLSEISAPTPAPTTIQPGVPVLFGSKPAMSVTASGNGTATIANPAPGITTLTYENGGASLGDSEATFVFDGTYEFAVTGATTSTASGVQVYITTAGALTLTVGSNVAFGKTDYPKDYRKKAGRAPVQIGA